MFSDSTTQKKYGKNGIEQRPNLIYTGASLQPIWREEERGHPVLRQRPSPLTTKDKPMWIGRLRSGKLRLRDWGWIRRWMIFRTMI